MSSLCISSYLRRKRNPKNVGMQISLFCIEVTFSQNCWLINMCSQMLTLHVIILFFSSFFHFGHWENEPGWSIPFCSDNIANPGPFWPRVLGIWYHCLMPGAKYYIWVYKTEAWKHARYLCPICVCQRVVLFINSIWIWRCIIWIEGSHFVLGQTPLRLNAFESCYIRVLTTTYVYTKSYYSAKQT